MNPLTPFRTTTRQLRLLVFVPFVFSSLAARVQSAQLKYDPSGDLAAIGPLVGTGPIIVDQPRSAVAAVGDMVSWSVLTTGSPPLTYQWQMNSNNLPGATADTLFILSVAPTDFGAYRVIVGNAFGSATSSNALLQLDSDHDGLADSWEITYFGNITNYTGLDDYDSDHISNLDEFREGTAPKSGNSANPRLRIISDRGQVFVTPNLPYYTNGQTVTLFAVPDPGQEFLGYLGAGTYSSFYNLTTNPASLRMTDSETVRAIFGLSITNSLDVTNGWRIDQAGWYGQTNITHDGVDAVQSARAIWGTEAAVLELTNVMSKAGTVTFWWKVDGSPADYLFFWLNNSPRSGGIGTNVDWQLATYYLPAGTNRMRWIYQKGGNEVSEYNGLLYAPADAGWVDEVKFEEWADPLKDTYGDGLPDLWKLRYFDTLNVKPGDDPDRDGISNLAEYLDGTDPTSSSSLLPRLTVTATGGGTVVRTPDLPKYTYNQRVGLNAVPDTNNYFVIWTGAVSGTNTTNSLFMGGNKSLNATFGSPLATALDAPSLTWARGGSIGWFGQTNYSHDGVAAAQTGPVDSQQATWMETTVSGPGALTFWWKASSHTNFDFARLLIDGTETNRISGEVDWDPQVCYVPSGSHTLRWTFTNIAGFFSLTNGAWVDELKFAAGTSAPEILLEPTGLTVLQGSNLALRLVAAGSPPPTYQWYRNGISLGSAGTNSTLTLSNAAPAQTGSYYAEIRNPVQTNTSTAFTLTVLPVPPVNDNFVDRAVLSGTNGSSGYDFGATLESNEPNHDNQNPGFSVWWKWTPPATGKYRLVARSRDILYKLVAAVYTGTAVDNLTPVASGSQDAALTNGASLATVQVALNATVGTEYDVALGHTFGPAGYFTLQMVPAVPPPNDDFANRIPLAGAHVLASGSNLDATLESGEPALPGQPGGASVWWSWTAPRGGLVEVTLANTGFSPLLGVYSGTALNSLSLVAEGITDTNNLASAADFTATPGAVYQISVDGSAGQAGSVQLEILFKAPLLGTPGFSSSGQFGFSFTVPPNAGYAIDTSANLIDWSLVTTGTSPGSGTVTYVEPAAQPGLLRFYRVRLL